MLSAAQWQEYAGAIDNDATPSQVGPTAEDCLEVAVLIEACEGVSYEDLHFLAARGGLAALIEATRKAEKQFRWYGDLHAQKKAYDKANRNYKFADMLRALLPQTGEGEPITPTSPEH